MIILATHLQVLFWPLLKLSDADIMLNSACKKEEEEVEEEEGRFIQSRS